MKPLRILLLPPAALLAALLAAPAWSAPEVGMAHKAAPAAVNKLYIVQMADAPVVAYDGGIAGLRATRPARGQKIDPNSTEVSRYVGYLDAKHSEVVARAGGRKVYDYRYVFNGFAAELSAEQAEALKSVPGVISVEKDEARAMDTATTPGFLGLTDPGGLWSQAGAAGKAGEDVIIGLVDSGIWPEHPSFSDRVGSNGSGTQGDKLDYRQLPGWHGRCVPGDFFTAANCNQKLIGAQYFNAGWGGSAAVRAALPWEFISPRDYSGHGSHTASTAGGNRGVATTGPAAPFGTINGIAHRARIAAYKVCWETLDPNSGGCFNSDSVAAIDQAVADGVDVINFSISGTRTNFRDAVEIAFLFATDAGVFVAASAGNSGPASGTVAHPGPWLTTVAAGTHPRNMVGSATLGNGSTVTGASLATAAVGPVPFIDSTAAGIAGADATKVALCYAATDNGGVAVLDPAIVAGKIVLCDRGVIDRVHKSLAVKEAGGVGMILVNTSSNSLNADFHSVPTVHTADTNRAMLKAYAATAGATATINAGTVAAVAAPFTASFSSRGPLAASVNLIKPDLIAPGQDILAAVAPPNNSGRLFDIYSGTSMSSPHVAGLAALLKNLHPDWSPAMIKSALMTTAYDVLDGGNPLPVANMGAVILRQGAGHVKPNSATDPGLVFDAGFGDWLGFLCGTQLPTSFCTNAGVPVLHPSNLNSASLAMGALAGTQTARRRVTNVGPKATYSVSATGLDGFSVVVSPASFELNRGASQNLDITIARTTAPLNTRRGGFLTWTDGTHNVRIPVLATAVALAAPTQVSGSYDVQFGYSGAFTATPRGLVPATLTVDSIKGSGGADFDPATADGTVKSYSVVVPAGTSYARFSLFDSHVDAGSDLDLYVYNGTTLVGASGGSTSAEEVSLTNPAAGTYTVYVHGYATPAATANFTLFSWVLGTAAAGNMTVTAPSTATIGATGHIELGFTGLTAGTKYLGSVAYGGSSGLPAPTIVRVDP